jgi:hypothetical protein
VVFAAELEDALGGDHVLEAVLTEVTQVAVDERRRRPRNQHLSSMARGSNASSAVDVDADVLFFRAKRRARVQTTRAVRDQTTGRPLPPRDERMPPEQSDDGPRGHPHIQPLGCAGQGQLPAVDFATVDPESPLAIRPFAGVFEWAV